MEMAQTKTCGIGERMMSKTEVIRKQQAEIKTMREALEEILNLSVLSYSATINRVARQALESDDEG